MPRAPRLVDVSVLLAPGIAAYPGNPDVRDHAGQARSRTGDSSNVSRLVMGTHTGTHVDAPQHFFDDKPGVDALPLELLIGRARVIDLPHRGGITEAHLAAAGLREDIRVLLQDAELGAVELARRLPHRLHLPHGGGAHASWSSRASRSSASTTSRSSSSRSRARRRTMRCSATA